MLAGMSTNLTLLAVLVVSNLVLGVAAVWACVRVLQLDGEAEMVQEEFEAVHSRVGDLETAKAFRRRGGLR
jgi:hypothetical protein